MNNIRNHPEYKIIREAGEGIYKESVQISTILRDHEEQIMGIRIHGSGNNIVRKSGSSNAIEELKNKFPLIELLDCTVTQPRDISIRSDLTALYYQDPWHVHHMSSEEKEYEHVVLRKPPSISRPIPTLYSSVREIQNAISRILDQSPHSDEVVNEILYILSQYSDAFSLKKEYGLLREYIQEHYPNYTIDIFNQIEKNKKYSGSWNNKRAISRIQRDDLNIQDHCLIHGRPVSTYKKKNKIDTVML